MKNTLVIVADLGCYKAYHVENDQLSRSPRLELLEQFENPAAHDRLVDNVSDQAGRFPRRTGGATAAGAMSDGERHNIDLERRKRMVRQLASGINAIGRAPEYERILLAASREINGQLLEELEPRLRAKLEQNIVADLTKGTREQLLRQLLPMPKQGAVGGGVGARAPA